MSVKKIFHCHIPSPKLILSVYQTVKKEKEVTLIKGDLSLNNIGIYVVGFVGKTDAKLDFCTRIRYERSTIIA